MAILAVDEISAGQKPVFLGEHLEEALAQAALEGLHPSAEALAALEAVADGSLSGENYLEQVKLRYGQ